MPTLTRIHRRGNTPQRQSSSPTAPSSDETAAPSSPPDQYLPETRPSVFCTMSERDLLTAQGRLKANLEEDGVLSDILQRAGFIKRGINLWVNIPQTVNVGSAMELLDHYAHMDRDDALYNLDEEERAKIVIKNWSGDLHQGHFNANPFNYLEGSANVPAFTKPVLLTGRENMNKAIQGDIVVIEIKSAADNARNTDTGSLKKELHRYVIKDGEPNPPLEADKSKLGVNHPQLLRMIVPMSTLHAHGEEAEFEAMVKAKKYPIDNRSVPAFMYDIERYDPSSPLEGLLRGHYPIRVFKHIFIAPSAGLAGPGEMGRSTRPGNASLGGAVECTPAMIAYACVQARFQISTRKTFGVTDGKFNMVKFYYDIIEILENKSSSWVTETLYWWNRQVFGDGEIEPSEDEDEQDNEVLVDDESSFANILAMVNDQALPIQPSSLPLPSQTQADSQYEANAFADAQA